MAGREDQLPTIRDAQAVLAELLDAGFGELPVQLLVVPDSTAQALGRREGWRDGNRPVLMLDYSSQPGRPAFSIVNVERLGDLNLPARGVQ